MLIAASILALSLANSPASCIAPTQTGVFRFTATTKDSSNASVGLVLLESVGNCLEASIMAEGAGLAIVEKLDLKDDTLTGRVRLSNGMADVALHLSPADISGSIKSSKQSWLLSGRRTTGSTVQSAGGDVALTKTP